MDIDSVRLWATVAAIGMGTIFPAISIGWIGSSSVKAIGRNPEAASKVQTMAILAIAFAEAVAIYALVIALIVKFVA
jgi:F-type H+-transporting ATPase subunit c